MIVFLVLREEQKKEQECTGVWWDKVIRGQVTKEEGISWCSINGVEDSLEKRVCIPER